MIELQEAANSHFLSLMGGEMFFRQALTLLPFLGQGCMAHAAKAVHDKFMKKTTYTGRKNKN